MRAFGISELDELPEFDSLGQTVEETEQIEMAEVTAYRQTEMGITGSEDTDDEKPNAESNPTDESGSENTYNEQGDNSVESDNGQDTPKGEE